MGVCQTVLPFLTEPLTYIGLAGIGLLGKLAYSYSSYSFIPRFLAFSNIVRLSGSVSSVLNFIWRKNLLFAAAVLTTFSGTVKAFLSGGYNGFLDLFFIAGVEVFNKVALTVKQLVEGLGYLAKWISQEGGVCTYVNSWEILLSALASFWVAAAAYIFAIRVYDWVWGKGMTRDIDWPEVMLVVVAVTLISITVYGTSILLEGGNALQNILNGVQNSSAVNQTVNSSNTTTF